MATPNLCIIQVQDFVFYDPQKEMQGEQKPEYGDWWGLIHRSWQSFHHPNHGKLSSAVNRRFTAALLDSPNQQRVCEEMRLKLMSLAPESLSETLNADLAPDRPTHQTPSGTRPATTQDSETPARDSAPVRPRRGRRPIPERDQQELAEIVAPYLKDNAWKQASNLVRICNKLDKAKVSGPKGHTWARLLENDEIDETRTVIDNIRYRLYKSSNPAIKLVPQQ